MKFILIGLFALFVQIPFAFSLDENICENVSQIYESDCREIINLDLNDDDKIFLIEHLEETYSVFDTQIYSGLFSDDPPIIEEDFNYNPREEILKKFQLICSLIFLFSFNYFLYQILKKCSREIKWIAE